MKYLRLFKESYDEKVFLDDSFLDNLIDDINLVFIDFVDDNEDALWINDAYKYRGFIEVNVEYVQDEYSKDSLKITEYQKGDFNRYINWLKNKITIMEDVYTGVKRLSDMYPELDFIPQDWNSSSLVRIRIFKK
jgi:hypothetical protein